MGFFDSILGKDASDASNAAAADTYRKQQAATSAYKSYGDTLPGIYNGLAAGYDPSNPTGTGTGGALSQLLQNPDSVRSLPGYQFAQGEGIRALDHSASSRGMLNSGRNEKDVMRFSQGLADQTYGNQLNRLMALKGAQNSTISQGVQGQLGTRSAAYQGEMGSAGTVGQGMVAGAQAEQNALTNLMNIGGYLGGSYLGGKSGGSSYGGGSYNPRSTGALY